MGDDSAGRSSGSAFSLVTSRGWVSAQSTDRSPSSSSSSAMARPLSGGSSMYWSYSSISNSCSSSPMSSGPGPVLSSLVMAPILPQRPAGHAGTVPVPGSNRPNRLAAGGAAAQLDQAGAHDLLELGLEPQDGGQLPAGLPRPGGPPGLDDGGEDRGDVAQPAGRVESDDDPAPVLGVPLP